MNKNQKLILLIHELQSFITPNTDVFWSTYNHVHEIQSKLNQIVSDLTNQLDIHKQIKLLIAPTGDLKEISLSNGWGDQFIEISNKIESELGRSALK